MIVIVIPARIIVGVDLWMHDCGYGTLIDASRYNLHVLSFRSLDPAQMKYLFLVQGRLHLESPG